VSKLGIELPWFQRFIFIIFIAKGRGKINLWNQDRIEWDRYEKYCLTRQLKLNISDVDLAF
jgi:hypothetical protein